MRDMTSIGAAKTQLGFKTTQSFLGNYPRCRDFLVVLGEVSSKPEAIQWSYAIVYTACPVGQSDKRDPLICWYVMVEIAS